MSKVSIGIMCFNEERNIGHLLDGILKEDVSPDEIIEIIVVSSGSTDNTESIVRKTAGKHPVVKLIVQEKRCGKNSAINLFLSRKNNDADILMVISGDVLIKAGSLGNFIKPFEGIKVGMTGGRPVPLNNLNTFFGFSGNLIWEIHHEISMVSPKLGEAIAFRNIIISLPEDLAVDEAYIESVFIKRGYELVYCPGAVIYNKAPETLMDFLKQRRRIETGHFYLRKKYGYHASTDFFIFKLKALLSILFIKRPGYFIPRLPYVVILYFLLKYARMLAYYDVFVARKNHCVWDAVVSTKDLSERY